MNDLYIENTYSTPKIHLNAKNGVLKIEGRSIPENPSSFYEPVASWILEFFKNPVKRTKLEIKLDYINSGSSKSILSLLKLIKKYADNGIDIEINWYYEEDDESIRDLGKHYKSILKLPLNLIETIS